MEELGFSVAQARAGGGENYVDIGGGGSSYSGGGRSGGSGFYVGSYDSPGSFVVGIIILIIVIYVIKKVRSKMAHGISQGVQTQMAGVTPGIGVPIADFSASLAALKQKDPSFDEQNFKDKAGTAFQKVQYAWEKKDMEIARAFVTDSIMQRYTVQLQQLKDKHWTNKMENLAVGSTEIAEVAQDEKFDKITVRISASAADYTVDDATGKIVKGSQALAHFTEYWTFIRSKSAHTDANKSLKDSKCPSCGASLEVSATGKCNYCGSVVTSGEYDWVLSEITQKGDWDRKHMGQIFQGGTGGPDISQAVGNAVAGAIIGGLLGGFRRRR